MDPTNIVLSSTYDTDKIVFTQTGSVAISSLPDEYNMYGYVIKKLAIPHGKGRPLFIDFRFSVDGGTTWRTGCGNEAAMGYSDATNLVIIMLPSLTGTFMYEVFGSWITDYDSTKPYIAPVDADSKTYFDSRLNYRKIAKQGSIDVVYNGALHYGISTLAHGLGHRPVYSAYFNSRPNEVWQQMAGGIRNPWLFDYSMGEVYTFSDLTNVTFISPGDIKVWYKVYGDE